MKKSNSNAFITKDSEVQGFMESAAAFLKRHYKVIILIFLGYISVSVLNFFDVATSQTIANYSRYPTGLYMLQGLFRRTN